MPGAINKERSLRRPRLKQLALRVGFETGGGQAEISFFSSVATGDVGRGIDEMCDSDVLAEINGT